MFLYYFNEDQILIANILDSNVITESHEQITFSPKQQGYYTSVSAN